MVTKRFGDAARLDCWRIVVRHCRQVQLLWGAFECWTWCAGGGSSAVEPPPKDV